MSALRIAIGMPLVDMYMKVWAGENQAVEAIVGDRRIVQVERLQGLDFGHGSQAPIGDFWSHEVQKSQLRQFCSA